MKFQKWDILYISKFPESIVCGNKNCKRDITVSNTICSFCNNPVNISNLVAKIRPILLWIDQEKWHESMSFGIPLSASQCLKNDDYNQPILLNEYLFTHQNKKYQIPIRALIHQATRIDGNVLNNDRLIGKITDTIIQEKIEKKMLAWLFNKVGI